MTSARVTIELHAAYPSTWAWKRRITDLQQQATRGRLTDVRGRCVALPDSDVRDKYEITGSTRLYLLRWSQCPRLGFRWGRVALRGCDYDVDSSRYRPVH